MANGSEVIFELGVGSTKLEAGLLAERLLVTGYYSNQLLAPAIILLPVQTILRMEKT